ncbi:MAG: helix-turn-helix domain containing protein [Legionella sp.]|uniref:TetR/AcrR family transcriptional regulator n=1 Tax=Legionella sp. TaxID=459 RepID=UPI002850A509|nr:helix-turn-helix domain containing protein [Legionella sp.]
MAGTKILNKRSVIIDAARALFARQTFEKTTIEEIAKSIPMSKGTLYTEFSSKEEIMLEICREHCRYVVEMMNTTATNSSSDHIDNLKEMLMGAVLYVHGQAQSVQTPEALVYVSNKVNGEMSSFFQAQQAQIIVLLKKAANANEISEEMDLLQLSSTLMSILSAYLPPYNRPLFPKDARPTKRALEKDYKIFLDLFFNGLKRQPSYR